eukprot:UN04322
MCLPTNKIWYAMRVYSNEDGVMKMVINVEGVAMYKYTYFICYVILAMFVTLVFSDVDLKNTLLVEWFGYNNVCVFLMILRFHILGLYYMYLLCVWHLQNRS